MVLVPRGEEDGWEEVQPLAAKPSAPVEDPLAASIARRAEESVRQHVALLQHAASVRDYGGEHGEQPEHDASRLQQEDWRLAHTKQLEE